MNKEHILHDLVHQLAQGKPVDWEATSSTEQVPQGALQCLRVLDRISSLGRAERRAINELVGADETTAHETSQSAPVPIVVEAPGRAWGPLQIKEMIGEGSSGEVFRAHDPALQIDVALKLWRREWCSPTSTDLLLQEARALARIRHTNILPVLGAAIHDGRVGMWTELVRGDTLESILANRGLYGADEAALIGAELCRALAAVHSAGLVHRDVKTRNVMRAGGGRIVLMDFGSALQVQPDSSAVDDDKLNGTPLTMAPEQLLDGSVGPPADIYGLAVLLYRLVSKRYPVEASTIEELAERHRRGDRQSLRDLRPDLPIAFIRLVERGLHADPAARYPSAGAFETALMDFLRDAGSSGHGGERRKAAGVADTHATDATGEQALERTATPNNLPHRRTHFIGREHELTECTELLDRARLITLTGIGGCGKTRLALRLTENLLDRFPDGAWFVDLSSVQDASRVALTMASAVNVTEEPGTPLIARLTERLRNHRVLIVLDNCEHVLATAVELADALLASCPELKMIATSREGLGIDGETVVALRSLSVPAAAAKEPSAIATSEAVQLFLNRAQLVDPQFELDEESAPAVADVCRRLDGIPLAIELAAARMKALSIDEIRARLDDRFRLLTGGGKTTPARHQTLRATIQWSHDQFSEEEQRLFRLLSVFTGGWTLDAATRVAGDDTDEFAVLDAITHMIEKSVMMAERTSSGSTRYTMLETVRQYAQERLDESAEGDAVRDVHLSYYLALVEEADPKLLGPEQGMWFSRLDHERENILTAHAWCDHVEGGAEMGLRLVFAIRNYWPTRGLLQLGHRVTSEALARPGGKGRTATRCRALFALGQLAFFMGRYPETTAEISESLSIAREMNDRRRMTAALVMLGMAAQGQAESAAARRHYEEALALAREQGDKMWLSTSISALAELHRAAGNPDAAEPLYQESVALSRELGSRQNIALDLANLSRVSIGRGNGARVKEMLLEALTIAGEIGSKAMGQTVLDVSSGLAAFLEEWERAARYYGASAAQSEQMGLHRWPADEAFLSPLIAQARENLKSAEFAAAESAGRALSYDEAVADVRGWLEGAG